jgi:hypothetical protein
VRGLLPWGPRSGGLSSGGASSFEVSPPLKAPPPAEPILLAAGDAVPPVDGSSALLVAGGAPAAASARASHRVAAAGRTAARRSRGGRGPSAAGSSRALGVFQVVLHTRDFSTLVKVHSLHSPTENPGPAPPDRESLAPVRSTLPAGRSSSVISSVTVPS